MPHRHVTPCPRCASTFVDERKPSHGAGMKAIGGIYLGLVVLVGAIAAFDASTGPYLGMLGGAACVVTGVVTEIIAACTVPLRCATCSYDWDVPVWQLPSS